MEIISKLVEIKAKYPIDNIEIEKELSVLGYNPLRWAIVKCGSRVCKLEGRALLACRAETVRLRRKSLRRKLNRSIRVNNNILTISLACVNL